MVYSAIYFNLNVTLVFNLFNFLASLTCYEVKKLQTCKKNGNEKNYVQEQKMMKQLPKTITNQITLDYKKCILIKEKNNVHD